MPLHCGLGEWSGCTESRVGTAHDYSGEKAQACLEIMGDFIDDAIGLYQTMTKRRIAEHVPAGFVDLSHLKVSQSHLAFVSLFDDTEDVWKQEDFSLVEQQSQVARWSRPDEFERILLAA